MCPGESSAACGLKQSLTVLLSVRKPSLYLLHEQDAVCSSDGGRDDHTPPPQRSYESKSH